MKIKLLALAVGLATTSFGTLASDNVGKKVWDSFRSQGVSIHSTRPSQFDTRFGTHWSGGYVRLRTKQTKAKNVMDFTPPRLSSGCSGIDFYAGSFSLLSGDELVQMYRGAMQGAAAYFFGIALQSLCPSCQDIAADIQEKIEKMNEFLRTDCKSITESEWGQSVARDIQETVSTKTDWFKRDNGLSDGHDSTLGNDNDVTNTPPTILQAAIDANAVMDFMQDVTVTDVGSFGPFFTSVQGGLNTGMDSIISNPSLRGVATYLMSLMGTFTSSSITDAAECQDRKNSGQSCIKVDAVPATLSFSQLAFGSPSGVTYNVCDSSVNDCSVVKQQEVTTPMVGMLDYTRELIAGNSSHDGLLQLLHGTKTRSEIQSAYLGTQILQLVDSTNVPWVRWAEVTKNQSGYDVDTVAQAVALQVTEHYMFELKDTLDQILAKRKPSDANGPNLDTPYETMREKLDESYKAFKTEIDSRNKTLYQTIQMNAQFKSILRGE